MGAGQVPLGHLGISPRCSAKILSAASLSAPSLISQRPDPVAAFDRLPDVEAGECAARVLGHLVEGQHVSLVIEEVAGVEESDSPELAQSLLGRDPDSLQGAVSEGVELIENRVLLQQPVGVHRGRRGGVAGTDGGLRAISVFQVFDNEAFLPRIELRSVSGHGSLPSAGNWLNLMQIESYHLLSFSIV